MQQEGLRRDLEYQRKMEELNAHAAKSGFEAYERGLTEGSATESLRCQREERTFCIGTPSTTPRKMSVSSRQAPGDGLHEYEKETVRPDRAWLNVQSPTAVVQPQVVKTEALAPATAVDAATSASPCNTPATQPASSGRVQAPTQAPNSPRPPLHLALPFGTICWRSPQRSRNAWRLLRALAEGSLTHWLASASAFKTMLRPLGPPLELARRGTLRS